MRCEFKEHEDGYICNNCGKYKRRPTIRNCPATNGLGEKIAKVTKALKIPECGGCKKRRQALNRMGEKVKQWVKNENEK